MQRIDPHVIWLFKREANTGAEKIAVISDYGKQKTDDFFKTCF